MNITGLTNKGKIPLIILVILMISSLYLSNVFTQEKIGNKKYKD